MSSIFEMLLGVSPNTPTNKQPPVIQQPPVSSEQQALAKIMRLKKDYEIYHENSTKEADRWAQAAIGHHKNGRSQAAIDAFQQSQRCRTTAQSWYQKLADLDNQIQKHQKTKSTVTHISATQELHKATSSLASAVDADAFEDLREEMEDENEDLDRIEDLIARPLGESKSSLTARERETKTANDFAAFLRQNERPETMTSSSSSVSHSLRPELKKQEQRQQTGSAIDLDQLLASAPDVPQSSASSVGSSSTRPVALALEETSGGPVSAQKAKLDALAQKMRAASSGKK